MSPSELGSVPDAVELAAGDGAARHPSREQSRNTAAKATTQPILNVLLLLSRNLFAYSLKAYYSLALIITKFSRVLTGYNIATYKATLFCMCQVQCTCTVYA